MEQPAGGTCLPDGGADQVQLAEWETVVDHLDEFCQGGKFTVTDDRVICEFPNAKVVVTRDGTVETGMPLHAFERDGVETLLFDHDRGELTVAIDGDGGRLRYTFHRP
ncbi:hypothetical protein ACFR9U_01135 [Halorientalis brevis]|uniref:Halobacterial output domain-containing protein n=1 Tax=Halorientalis brevis TaxID=1126241 RepID=A0ABD6C6Y8_9EURY|nr:hypothetical protein [Halorientalis brevis]